jgi:hypothetical protein
MDSDWIQIINDVKPGSGHAVQQPELDSLSSKKELYDAVAPECVRSTSKFPTANQIGRHLPKRGMQIGTRRSPSEAQTTKFSEPRGKVLRTLEKHSQYPKHKFSELGTRVLRTYKGSSQNPAK